MLLIIKVLRLHHLGPKGFFEVTGVIILEVSLALKLVILLTTKLATLFIEEAHQIQKIQSL